MKISCWITRTGEIHKCDFAGHFDKAEELGYDEEILEDTGWIKVSAGTIHYNSRHPLTPEQEYTLSKLALKENFINEFYDFIYEHGNNN